MDRKQTLSALKLKLGMNMTNPNDFALPITRIDWELDIFGRALADGIVKLDKEVPAQGSSRFSLPLSVSLAKAASKVSDLLSGRRIPYKIGGEVTLSSPFGPVGASFSRKGTWDNPLVGFGPRPATRSAEVVTEARLVLPEIPRVGCAPQGSITTETSIRE